MSDLISRQAAIDAMLGDKVEITNVIRALGNERDFEVLNCTCDRHAQIIKDLPTVQPKHGKWLPDNRCGGGYWVCSSCKYPTEAFAADVIYKYCPFCGADMRGEAE